MLIFWTNRHTPWNRVREAIQRHLRPELINRLSSIVQFQPLQADHIREIVGKCLAALNARLTERHIVICLSPEVVDLLVKEGFSPEFGARELERTMESLISKPLAEELLCGSIQPGQRITAQWADGGIKFSRGLCSEGD